jgi:SAM-dependent methyltransferase
MSNNLEQVREAVRDRYGRVATNVLNTKSTDSGCCGGSPCCGGSSNSTSCGSDPITSNIYSDTELGEIPQTAALASLGCGNPSALAELKPGEKVLDLGSGGGIDVLLSARRVGTEGFAYGLDMTDEMLMLAEHNRAEAGITNVQFLKGVIEDIPLPENTVDVVISNCVINLSADKKQVLREAYRVLVPGGRFAVSDIVIQAAMPETVRRDIEAWAGCISGALEEKMYRHLLSEVGFVDIDIEIIRRYSLQDITESGGSSLIASFSEEERGALDGKFASAFVRAHKPA